mgnify:CR=1 FL=1|jgi:uncharacterized membrane protein
MKEKNFKISLSLLLITLIIVLISMAFMPKEIPLHYDLQGNIDNYGSKYWFLLIPFLAFLTWGLLHLIARSFKKQNKNSNSKITYIASSCTMIMFIILELIFIVIEFKKMDSISIENIIYRTANIGLGLTFILIGNVLPKITKNKVIGLRTTWSLYNDNTWNTSQRQGGYMIIGIGFAMIIASIFVFGVYNLFVLFGSISIMLILAYVISYQAYKKEINKATTK